MFENLRPCCNQHLRDILTNELNEGETRLQTECRGCRRPIDADYRITRGLAGAKIHDFLKAWYVNMGCCTEFVTSLALPLSNPYQCPECHRRIHVYQAPLSEQRSQDDDFTDGSLVELSPIISHFEYLD